MLDCGKLIGLPIIHAILQLHAAPCTIPYLPQSRVAASLECSISTSLMSIITRPEVVHLQLFPILHCNEVKVKRFIGK